VQKLEPRRRPKSNSDAWRGGLFRALFLAIVLAFTAGSARADEPSIPPAPQRWVTDRAGLLSPAALTRLDGKLEAYEQKTGHQVVVWVGQTIGSAPLDDFAVKTFKAWQLGRKGSDDGLLLLVLAKDRKMAIEVGYGLEARVPDAVASRIINDVIAPPLRDGDADAAIEAGVSAILSAIDGQPFAYAPDSTTHQVDKGRPSTVELVGFGILALAFLILFITHPSLAINLLIVLASGRGNDRGGGGMGSGGGFGGGGGRSGGGGARGSW
jgi:uncharacterized protein